MKLADVKVGMRVTSDTCGYGTVRRVDYGAVFVQLDLDAEKRPGYNRAFTCEHIEPLEQEPRPVTATEVNVMAEAERARLQMLQDGNDRYWQRAVGSWTEPPLLTPVPPTVEQLVQSSIAEADAITGSGLAEWMRNHHPVDHSIRPQITNEPASLRRTRELAEHAGGRGEAAQLTRDYIAAYQSYLAGVVMGQVPKEIVPTKPLAIGTPPRKLCLPEKP